MEAKQTKPTPLGGPGQNDLLSATSPVSYKCANCGNMFPTDQVNCEVCGFKCSHDACHVVHSSDQGY